MTRGKSSDDSTLLGKVLTPACRVLAIYNNNIYDLSDYLQTLADNNGGSGYSYLDGDLVALYKQQPGQDITKSADQVYASMDASKASATKICLNNLFYIGQTDFRKGPRCQIPNYLLLAFSALIALTILVKCKYLGLSFAC
jgi:chitin synthase